MTLESRFIAGLALLVACTTCAAAKPDRRVDLLIERIELATAAAVCGVAKDEVANRLDMTHRWLIEEAPWNAKKLNKAFLETEEDHIDIARDRKQSDAGFCSKTRDAFWAKRVSWWRYPR
jgi:hypothetical protein